MNYIYVGQSSLRIQLTTGVDITSAESLKIKYKKPNGTEGYWNATSSDDSNGIIYSDLSVPSDLDVSGNWALWAHVTFSDSRTAPGQIFKLKVFAEGTK